MSVKQIQRSALVTFSAERMFALVNDIEAYPSFMEGCVSAVVLERSEQEVLARLELQKMGVKQAFTTRNTLTPPHCMQMTLVDGPFKVFTGKWEFTALGADACKVVFELNYEFANSLLSMMAGKWMEAVANEQVEAICQRAKQVYGAAGA
ncbi:MAG TPA: type II toxin-antitoxin system RatA family toxin [Cellvibrionaceae bacterium]|nr:type II toxin-antitoxin system RatA family toxin [Cellvibrionaceae bacterium]